MSNPIRRRVSATEEPDDFREDEPTVDQARRKYEPTLGPMQYIPETRLDDIRLEAYYDTAYPNSYVEEQTLAAVDRAIAERVQMLAQRTLEQAAKLLEDDGAPKLSGPRELPNTLAKADAHLDELAAIKRELRDGKVPTTELAARYERVRKAMATRDGRSLVALANRATSLRERVADPKAAVGKAYSVTPLSLWRSLGVHHW